jgi:signal transduction histidine kinase
VSKPRIPGSSFAKKRTRGPSRASAGSRLEPPDPHLSQFVVDQSSDFILWFGSDARFIYGNAAFRDALGYTLEGLRALHLWDVEPLARKSWPRRWADLKSRPDQTFLTELRTKTAGTVLSQVRARYLSDEGAEYAVYCGRDLREHAALVDHPDLPESVIDAIFILDEGKIVQGPERHDSLHQKIREDLETMLREWETIQRHLSRALQGEAVKFHWSSAPSDGRRVNLECALSRIEIEGHVRLLAIVVDITVRRRSARTLAQLSGRLLELQDEERRRIARELHDGTGQTLSALSMNLSSMLSSSARLTQRAREELRESLVLAENGLREIRTLSYLLHPPLLDEAGLLAGLSAYADGFSKRTGIRIELDFPELMPRLPEAVEIALFRIVQESFSNIHRHSGSRTALLRIKRSRDSVELEVLDQGRGIPTAAPEWEVISASRIGVGIAGMRERARQLGGTLTIGSGDWGTRVHVVLPVPESTSARA